MNPMRSIATLREWAHRLAGTIGRGRTDRDLEEELRFHLDLTAEEALRGGTSAEGAGRAATLEAGGLSQSVEALRDQRGLRWIADFVQDLRYAARTLRRSPGFSAVAVLLLALGIGANAAIFTLINAIMLRTLPVPEPGRLVQIARLLDGRPGVVSYPLFRYFHDNIRSIASAFAQVTSNLLVAIDGDEDFVTAEYVSGSHALVLGIAPAAGRLLSPSDDEPNATAVVVITDRYWSRRFGRSAAVLGKMMTVRDRPFTIVGVTPAAYQSARAGSAPDILLPLSAMMTPQQRQSSDFNFLNMLARLKPGATVDDVNAEAQVLFASFVQAQANALSEKERAAVLRQRAVVLPAPDGFNPIRDTIAMPLLLLMGIVGLILLLACVNLSGLLLARAPARSREVAIRLAIGAGRGRLVRQLLTESLVLASAGGGAGLGLAAWFSGKLFSVFVDGRDVVLPIGPDWRVVAFTLAVSVAASCTAGLAPALHAVRTNVNPALTGTGTARRRRLSESVVVAQIAVSMVLLVSAALFVGTLLKLQAADRGFTSDGLLVVGLRSSRPYPPARIAPVRDAILGTLRSLPGVQSASAAQLLPVSGLLWDRRVAVEGYSFGPGESETVGFNAIAPGYFATLATPVVEGREFTDRDTGASPRVAVVNESFARHFFSGGSALGKRVTSVDVTYEIVGVVGDAKYQRLRDSVIETLYIPWTQRPGEQPTIFNYIVRVTGGDPMRLAPLLDRAVRNADSGLHVRAAIAYDTIIDRSISTERIMAALGGMFGALALLVAGVGIFGVLAFQVARRTHELGVRMALGATRTNLMQCVLRDVLWMLGLGLPLGALGAFGATGLAGTLVFGMTAHDPRVFIVAALIMSAGALVAAWVPARRASRIDPIAALRHE
ncbi:MAG: hypothetical protein DMG02_20495 [Acidobacteria bacterium]|nr:MAG: hypothetical protein DMG02_20495 [Acidobacteriota bacterium]